MTRAAPAVARGREVDMQLRGKRVIKPGAARGRSRPSSRNCPSCRRCGCGLSGRDRACSKMQGPVLVRLPVELGRVAFARQVDGGVEGVLWENPRLRSRSSQAQSIARLEVVAEGPIASISKKVLVVGVEAHVLQVVVLAARPRMHFLRVRPAAGPPKGPRRGRRDSRARTGSSPHW